jgi:hypothetical protein
MTGYAGQCTRVYALHGKMAHLLAPWESPNLGYAFTLCRRQPRLFTAWLGTGSQAEYERAASLPACEQCLRAAAKTEAGQARPGGTSTQDFPAGSPPSGGELNAAAASSAAVAPGNPMYARENVATGDPRADCGTAAASATPRAGTAAPEPVSGAGHPPAPLTAESAPDGTGSVPGAERGTLEPPTRARARTAPAAATGGSGRGTQGPAADRPGPVTADGGQAGRCSPAAARAAAASTAGGSGFPSRWGQPGGSAGPGGSSPGPAQASPPADQGPAGGEQGPAGGGRPRAPLAGQAPGAATGRSSAAAPGPKRLRGQDARDAVRAAESKLAAAKRAGRGRYRAKRAGDGYGPGMTRRMPPEAKP